MRDITAVPTEIWDCIITGACTDGGYTGRSLALTNKFFHSQSLSNRLSSVRLTSLARVETFLSFLDAQTKECKPKIRHLFLSFLDKTEPIGTPFVDYSQGRGAPGPAAGAIREWDERFVPSMTLLFSLAAPTLRTLCIITEKPSISLPAFPYGSLPVLEELTVHHSLDLFLPGDYACKDMWNSDFSFQLPALRRFHMIYDLWPNPGDSRIFARLSHYKPPNLTHVRVSGLSMPEYGFSTDLGRALGIPYVRQHTVVWTPVVEQASVPHTAPFLPNLRSVIVHGASPQSTGPCGTVSFYWVEFCDAVRNLARLVKQIRDVDVTVVALSRPSRRNWHWHERLFNDWVSRIEGGTGCWVESEDEEAKLDVYEDDPPLPDGFDWPLPDEDDDL